MIEGWEAQDERCPACGQVTKTQRGLNKQNLKRLFSLKANTSDWIVLFMLIMVLLIAWRYSVETEQCREFKNHIGEECIKYQHNLDLGEEMRKTNPYSLQLNMSNISLSV